jgi:hypothetical protein
MTRQVEDLVEKREGGRQCDLAPLKDFVVRRGRASSGVEAARRITFAAGRVIDIDSRRRHITKVGVGGVPLGRRPVQSRGTVEPPRSSSKAHAIGPSAEEPRSSLEICPNSAH